MESEQEPDVSELCGRDGSQQEKQKDRPVCTEKTEMAIPHQAFECVTHHHRPVRKPQASVSISLSDVSAVIQVKVK